MFSSIRLIRQGGGKIRVRHRQTQINIAAAVSVEEGHRREFDPSGRIRSSHIHDGFQNNHNDFRNLSRSQIRPFSLLPPARAKENADNRNGDKKKKSSASLLPEDKNGEVPRQRVKRRKKPRSKSATRQSDKNNGCTKKETKAIGTEAVAVSTRRRRRRRRRSSKPKEPLSAQEKNDYKDDNEQTPQQQSTLKANSERLVSTKPHKVAIRLNATIEQELQDWYEAQHGISFKDSCINLNGVFIVEGRFNMWKATFTCPITAESFTCGTLEEFQEHGGAKEQPNGEVLYFKMAAARAAAMARALDCFRHREQEQQQADDDSSFQKKLCLEQPYALGDSSFITTTKPEIAATSQQEDTESEPDQSDDEEGEEEEDDEEDDDEYFFISEEDNEEYTLQYLPGSSAPNDAGTSQLEVANPMARVLGNWTTQSGNLLTTIETSSKTIPDPEVELKRLVENARSWMNQEEQSHVNNSNSREPQVEDQQEQQQQEQNENRVMLHAVNSPHTLEIANSVLNGLAKANRRVAFLSSKPRGVDDIATRIVRYLRSTDSAQPNVNTFIAYLGCMEGTNPLDVATRAQQLLGRMNERATADVAAAGAKAYPKPTIGVVNAVIQLWAQVGGDSGRFNLDQIENPNRETFLSVLSSMTYPPTVAEESGGFDPIFAQGVLDKMSRLAEDNPNDDSLRPDVQVYNAGLRWSGGFQSTITRPYMRAIMPWDSHAKILKDGFVPLNEDHHTVQEAYRMHAWLEEMMSLETVHPNIETYEAVIQAYVRTGTKEGVKQAESLLNLLVGASSSSSLEPKPRPQTFHPVIAAWAYSGHRDAPQKVNKWIDYLDTWSEETNTTEFRMLEVPLIASTMRVIRRMQEVEEPSDTEASDLIDVAHGCSSGLKDLCALVHVENRMNGVSVTLHSNAFLLVLRAWSVLGLHFFKHPDGSHHGKHALQEMFSIVDDFEELIASLRRAEATDDNVTPQVSHLMDGAPEVYSLLSTTLRDAKRFDSNWMPEPYMYLEKWARRIDEFNRVQHPEGKRGGDLIHGDMYNYERPELEGVRVSGSEAEFFVHVLRTLQDEHDSIPPQQRGDMIRLCIHIMRVLPFVNSDLNPYLSLTATYKEVVRAICRLASGRSETEALLAGILSQIEWVRGQRPTRTIDRSAIVKEMQKLHPSLPGNYERRSRHSRRGFGRPFRRHRSATPPRRSNSSLTS